MLFYGKYENGQYYICAYDEEKHGAPRVVLNTLAFIYHNSISVNRVYKTEQEAMANSWGKSISACYTVSPGQNSPFTSHHETNTSFISSVPK